MLLITVISVESHLKVKIVLEIAFSYYVSITCQNMELS